MTCSFKDVLGKPSSGIHSIRIFNIALFDILLTIIAAIITSWIFKINFVLSILVWIIVGELLHILFGVQTQFLTSLGIKLKCSL